MDDFVTYPAKSIPKQPQVMQNYLNKIYSHKSEFDSVARQLKNCDNVIKSLEEHGNQNSGRLQFLIKDASRAMSDIFKAEQNARLFFRKQAFILSLKASTTSDCSKDEQKKVLKNGLVA